MTWGYGFLYDMGYSDFAGSGIVHLTGGIGALAGAAVTGARKQGNISRFDAEGANPDGPYARMPPSEPSSSGSDGTASILDSQGTIVLAVGN